MKILKIITLFTLFVYGFTPLSVASVDSSAHDFIKSITNDMLGELNTSKAEIRLKPSMVLDIVNQKIMPHMAVTTISRKVMGLPWKRASKEQKKKFVKEFSLYLKRYYSKAFLAFNNQTMEFDPKVKFHGKRIAVVTTKLIRSGEAPVTIKYKLYKKKGAWKVIDIIIEGISLVISNQRQYSGLIAREGLDAVTAKLAYNNQQEFK